MQRAGAALEKNIGGGQDKQVNGDAFSRRPKNTRQNYQIKHSNSQKTSPLYNCLLVLLLHTAAVTKDLGGGKAQVWGGGTPPPPQSKTAPGNAVLAIIKPFVRPSFKRMIYVTKRTRFLPKFL